MGQYFVDMMIRVKANVVIFGFAVSKEFILKHFSPYTDCITGVNNIQIDNGKYRDVFMRMYNILEYNKNYSKSYKSLFQYTKD